MDDTETKSVYMKGWVLGYKEAWKIITGKYANDSKDGDFLYVEELIKSLDSGDNYQMRTIESSKTGRRYLVMEQISKKELEAEIETAHKKFMEFKEQANE